LLFGFIQGLICSFENFFNGVTFTKAGQSSGCSYANGFTFIMEFGIGDFSRILFAKPRALSSSVSGKMPINSSPP